VEVRVEPQGGGVGTQPKAGDVIIELRGRPIRSFVDFAWAHTEIRNAPIDPGGFLDRTKELSRDLTDSRLSLIEYTDDQTRYVRVRFRRQGADSILSGWRLLERQSAVRIGVTLLWFILQLAITLVSLIAAWHRPFDQSLRLFCFLGGVTLIAFVGGDHWWVISGRLWLLVPFAVSAILLPAVLLHFFLTYPMAKPWMAESPRLVLSAIYGVPIAMAITTVMIILSAHWLSASWGEGPFAMAIGHSLAHGSSFLMSTLQTLILGYLSISLLYFAGSLIAMAESLFRARSLVERQQVQWILCLLYTSDAADDM
jgi:hypothetical protein